MFEWFGPKRSLPPLVSSSPPLSERHWLTWGRLRDADARWWWGGGVKSERTSPSLRTHAQPKWSEDASSLSVGSPLQKPFSPLSAPNCPFPSLTTGGSRAAGARPARRRREEPTETGPPSPLERVRGGELRGGMGALTKGRYLSTTGVLLLVCCTASAISKGKSHIRSRACWLWLSLEMGSIGLLKKNIPLCHPRGYAPVVPLLSRLL